LRYEWKIASSTLSGEAEDDQGKESDAMLRGGETPGTSYDNQTPDFDIDDNFDAVSNYSKLYHHRLPMPMSNCQLENERLG